MGHYRKYMHIEHLDCPDAKGMFDVGVIHVQPKIDGTTACAWWEDGELQVGGHNRPFTREFLASDISSISDPGHLINDYRMGNKLLSMKWLETFAEMYEGCIIYGEFLIKNKIRNYRPECYNDFFIFDVYSFDRHAYLDPEKWKYDAVLCGCNVIPDLCVIDKSGVVAPALNNKALYTEEWWQDSINVNNYLFPEGYEGHGEGVVIKNYHFRTKDWKPLFVKVVSKEYKDLKVKRIPKEDGSFEQSIVEGFYPDEITTKIVSFMTNNNEDPWNRKKIPELLGRCFKDFVNERIWTILKMTKNPTINFKELERALIVHIKRVRPELF